MIYISFFANTFQAFHRRLYGQGIVYLSTMSFSLFYHLCDQEAFSGMLPEGLQKTCLVLYVNNEVLQFCDFFSALLSFWVRSLIINSAFKSILCHFFKANLFNVFRLPVWPCLHFLLKMPLTSLDLYFWPF